MVDLGINVHDSIFLSIIFLFVRLLFRSVVIRQLCTHVR